MQSPHDPDATYRKEDNIKSNGYAITVIEISQDFAAFIFNHFSFHFASLFNRRVYSLLYDISCHAG